MPDTPVTNLLAVSNILVFIIKLLDKLKLTRVMKDINIRQHINSKLFS